MCTVVLVVLPENADAERVASAAEELRPRLREVSNPHLAAQLGSGERVFTTTGAGCDCGTELGSAREDADALAVVSERDITKKRRKGWSDARIARWVEDRERGAATRERSRRHAAEHGLTREAAMWMAWLRALADERVLPWMGVLIHEFRGALDTERWELATTSEHAIADSDEVTLRTLAYDRVHRFTR